MAPELDVGMGVGMGIGIGMGMRGMRGMEAAASSFSSAYVCGLPTSDAMRIDDLLDFSNQDDFFDAAAANVSAAENHQHYFLPMQEPSATAGLNLDTSSSNSSTFSDQLYVPSEEAAELEWLSKFVDDSFSDVPFASSLGGFFDGGEAAIAKYTAVRPDPSAVPARARSKRSRAPANVLHHTLSTWPSPAPPNSPSLSTSSTSPSSSSSEFPPGSTSSSKPKATIGFGGRKEGGMEGGVRRCTHCASERTPQWRTGPLGPKTLCNACGVRFKSGRLVPEYRPAASPTFVLTQHSNSHRKVMELRRQKDLLLRHPGNAGGASSAEMTPDLLFGGYEAC